LKLFVGYTGYEDEKRNRDYTKSSKPLILLWRPQPDLNRCYRRERPVSWTWLDDGDVTKLNNVWMVTVEVFTSERVRAGFRISDAGYWTLICNPESRSQKPESCFSDGGPCENRTHDQRIKSPLLYQTELTARSQGTKVNPFTYLVKRFFGS
jgi:hypothetical protein